MRALLAACAAALAAVASGCGASSVADPFASVADAATKTAKADSARFHLVAKETVGPIGPLNITADGVSDNTTHRARLTMDLSSVAALSPGTSSDPNDWKGEAIADGTLEYLRIPALSKLIPGAKPWIKLDLQKLGKSRGFDFSQLLRGAGGQDPTEAIATLKTIGDVKEAGSETVDGVGTTKYTGTIDPKKLAAKIGTAKQLGTKPIPVEVWVAADGYVRKLHETYSTAVPAAGRLDMDLTVTLSDFGAAVDVTPPPADQTTDIAALGGTQ